MAATYALYHGDELVGIGTIRELARMRGVKESTIRFYSYPAYRRRVVDAKTAYLVVRVGQ